MSDKLEALRMMQAEFLSSLFETENGRPATDASEMNSWMMAKTKEQRTAIRKKMEAYIQAQLKSPE